MQANNQTQPQAPTPEENKAAAAPANNPAPEKTDAVAQNAPPPPQDAKTGSLSKNPIDQFDAVRTRCATIFGSEKRFIEEATFLLNIVNTNGDIAKCSKASLAGILLSVANIGLSLDPSQKLCYVIPRNIKIKVPGQADRWETRATLEPSYIGLMKIATDSGAVRNFESHDVYKGDEFEFDLIERVPKKHKPYWTLGVDRGKLIGVYGWAVLHDGTKIPEHMGADELAKIQSKSENRAGKIFDDWQGEMARKSLLKRLCKHIPRTEKTSALFQAVELDNQGYDMDRPAGVTPDMAGEQEARSRVLALMGLYEGPDKAALTKECRDAINTRRATTQFWLDMEAKIQSPK